MSEAWASARARYYKLFRAPGREDLEAVDRALIFATEVGSLYQASDEPYFEWLFKQAQAVLDVDGEL